MDSSLRLFYSLSVTTFDNTPITVLIADDSEIVRRALCNHLAYESTVSICGQAADYPELLRMIKEVKPEVVLMDIRMPGQAEISASEINSQLRGCCVLAMSLSDDEEIVIMAQSYGAVRLLDKSTLATELVPAIESCRPKETQPS
jgi:DNA-binding NarL/FixJ family response regulator